jgi:hypothetical protein
MGLGGWALLERTRLHIGFLLLSCLVGCATGASASRSYPAPTADELMAALRARQAAVRGLNLEARVTSWMGGERVRGTVQMLVDRNGDLRFEAEVSLQGVVAALVVHQGTFVYVDHQKKTFRMGPATPADVASLIRIPLPAQAVAAILLGDAYVPEGSRPLDVNWAEDADVLHLQTPAGELWMSLQRPVPQKPAWDVVAVSGQSTASKGRWRVSFGERQRWDGQAIPMLIRFAEPDRSFDDGVEIKVKERVVNPTFPPKAFVIEPPPGYSFETAKP